MKKRFVSLLLTFLLTSLCDAEVLHKWFEPKPDHSYTYAGTDEDLFYTYTTKDASRSESGGSWQLTGSATASANARAPLPRGEDFKTEFDVDARLRVTGDRHEVTPFHGNEVPATADGPERVKKSSDGTTTARTKRTVRVVSYKNNVDGTTEQSFLSASTSGGKSETSVSSTHLDADPWASSWLEVRRRVALNNEVPGSPFESKTPECKSSGTGHTCAGYVSPEEKKAIGHCERGAACNSPQTSVKNRPKAHVIKCPNQTYKQGNWAWLMLKIKEDCKGEKWSCHSDPDNCDRKHLHLKDASKAEQGETVFNGYVVPAGYSVGACGLHLYASSGSASQHAEKTGACGHTYYACTSGDHEKLQASCSTDTNCISTNFYLCQHSAHEYAKKLACGHLDDGGWQHFEIHYPACGHLDWYCLRRHGRKMCPFNAQNEKCTVDGGWMEKCNEHTHKYPSDVVVKPEDPKQVLKKTTDPKQTVLPKTPDEDEEDDSAPPPAPEVKPNPDPKSPVTVKTRPCGHPLTASGDHAWVSRCAVKNSRGDTCTNPVSYYACKAGQIHTHTYPAVPQAPPKPEPRLTGDCNRHQIAASEASKHAAVKHSCGRHSYYACQTPSASEKSRHLTQTLRCGRHVGHACSASSSHLQTTACPQKNGVSCSYGSYYACSPHVHAYPAPPKPKQPALEYHPCGHLLTASGNHSKVSSCSVKNSRGDGCTNGAAYYVCSPHVHSFPAAPKTPTSVAYPCGSHSYPSGQTPSSSEVSRHSSGTLPCGTHSGYACKAARSHTQEQTCPGKDGKACTIGSYYACTRPIHKHVYPETQKPNEVKQYACGHDTTHRRGSSYHAWVSSCNVSFGSDPCTVSGGYYYCTPHEHKFSATCSAGHSYNPENDSLENRHRVRTCLRPACGQTWQLCSGGKPSSCAASSSWRCRE